MKKTLLLIAALFAMLTASASTMRYAGGDISLLPDEVKNGAKYYDHEGKPVAEFLPWCREQGMNAMRVRLFVNPAKYKELHANDANDDTRYDANACQDLEYITPLCKDIVNAGLDLMLDFHYSDTWADPAKQWTPIDWEGLSDEELVARIYNYTRATLISLKEAGVTPMFIQTGNEISYGMLWGELGTKNPKKTLSGSNANWDRFGRLLNSAVKACREVCPDAKIIIHTERVANTGVLTNFYDRMSSLGIDYDIIGLSYYPFWHGGMDSLDKALTLLEGRYTDKNIMIVETGYAIKWQVPYPDIEDHTSIWPISDAGQAKFAQDLVDTLEKHPRVDGLFWWWMEYNPYGTDMQGWYNAPLFDPTTGRATSAFKVICSFATTPSGIETIDSDSNGDVQWYDISGRPVSPDTRGLIFSRQGKRLNR